jgi:hypothetical protein
MQEEPGAGQKILPPEVIPALGLSEEELAALAGQGFVSAAARRGGTVYYKLRFRCGGKQRVRCLGTDAALAARVRQELLQRQRRSGLDRELARQSRAARSLLRQLKARLDAYLQQEGFRFHGRAVRQRR